MRDLVAADASLSAADVGHSLVSTRSSFEHRAVVLGGDREEALAGLDLVAAGGDSARAVRGVATGPAGPVVFVFPGQGSQWLGMGRQLYAESEVFARAIDECARALAPWLDWSLVDLVTGAESAPSLERVDVVQPALFAMMVSLARVWRSLGVVPERGGGALAGRDRRGVRGGGALAQGRGTDRRPAQPGLTDLAGLGGMNAVAAAPEWVSGPVGAMVRAALRGRGQRAGIGGDLRGRRSGRVRARWRPVTVSGCAGSKVEYASHSHQVERIRDRVLEATAGVRRGKRRWRSTPRSPGGCSTPALSRQLVLVRQPALDGAFRRGRRRPDATTAVACSWRVSPHPVLQVAMEEAADARGDPAGGGEHPAASTTGVPARSWRRWPSCTCAGGPVNWKAAVHGGPAAPDRPADLPVPAAAVLAQLLAHSGGGGRGVLDGAAHGWTTTSYPCRRGFRPFRRRREGTGPRSRPREGRRRTGIFLQRIGRPRPAVQGVLLFNCFWSWKWTDCVDRTQAEGEPGAAAPYDLLITGHVVSLMATREAK